MYRSVSKIEQRMQNYGGNALRLNARSRGGNRGKNTETNSTRRSANDQQGIMCRVKRLVLMVCMVPRCLHRRDGQPPTSRSNRATSQKRAILHMAAGYDLAWALVFIPFLIPVFLHQSSPILTACLGPLQGLFNFLVFMSPKMRIAKQPRRGEKLTWRQEYYMPRGERRRTAGRNLSSGNSRTARSRVSSRVSWWKQRVQRFTKPLLSRRSARDTRSNESNVCTTHNDQSSTNPNKKVILIWAILIWKKQKEKIQ